MMRSMDNPNLFTYEVPLKRGFKYRHYFMIDGQDLVDETKKTEINKFGFPSKNH